MDVEASWQVSSTSQLIVSGLCEFAETSAREALALPLVAESGAACFLAPVALGALAAMLAGRLF